jgi:tetratricopeptide (TPR) repeat protein
LSQNTETKLYSAFLLARSNDRARAKALITELERSRPSDTLQNAYWIPIARAHMEMNSGNFAQALAFLETAAPYDLKSLNAAQARGQVYLRIHNGTAAAAEFRKVLDHGGVVRNNSIGAVAHLQVGQAYAMSGDTAQAKTAYQEFLTLWKDADPDIPILKQAKAEYAKLQ